MSNSRNSVSRGILIGQCNMAYNRIVKQGSPGHGKPGNSPGILLWHFPEGDWKVLEQG